MLIKTSDAHPLVISAIRSSTAAVCLLIYLRGKPRFTFSKPQIIGALCYAATLTSFVAANKLTTAANAILLQYSSPLFVALLSRLIFKEKMRRFDYASMTGIALGLALLLSGTDGFGSLAGNVVALSSGFFFGSFMVSLKMHKNGSQVETIILGNLVAALIGLPFIFTTAFSLTVIPPVAFLGAFQIAAPYAMFAKASESASALDMSVIPMIEPLLNPLWVYLVTKETPAPVTFAGGAVLLGVIFLRSVLMLRKQPKATNP